MLYCNTFWVFRVFLFKFEVLEEISLYIFIAFLSLFMSLTYTWQPFVFLSCFQSWNKFLSLLNQWFRILSTLWHSEPLKHISSSSLLARKISLWGVPSSRIWIRHLNVTGDRITVRKFSGFLIFSFCKKENKVENRIVSRKWGMVVWKFVNSHPSINPINFSRIWFKLLYITDDQIE